VAEYKPVLKSKGVVLILIIFKIDLCSAISFKRSRRELSIDVAEHKPVLKSKGVVLILIIFKIDLCSAISYKRSRRELSIDVAEHRSMSENYQNMHPF